MQASRLWTIFFNLSKLLAVRKKYFFLCFSCRIVCRPRFRPLRFSSVLLSLLFFEWGFLLILLAKLVHKKFCSDILILQASSGNLSFFLLLKVKLPYLLFWWKFLDQWTDKKVHAGIISWSVYLCYYGLKNSNSAVKITV